MPTLQTKEKSRITLWQFICIIGASVGMGILWTAGAEGFVVGTLSTLFIAIGIRIANYLNRNNL